LNLVCWVSGCLEERGPLSACVHTKPPEIPFLPEPPNLMGFYMEHTGRSSKTLIAQDGVYLQVTIMT